MFFIASKVFWGVFAPDHLMIWCSLLSVALLLAGRRRAGTFFALATAILLVGIGITPSYNWLGRSLESRFDGVALPARADGILVLAGGEEDIYRLPAAWSLARRYPGAEVVYSGGSGALFDGQPNVDALRAKAFLISLGLEPTRIVLEGHSRNTYESFIFTKAMVRPRPDQNWILVTSAYHMPRAMEIANQVQWKLFPRSSDRVSAPQGFPGWFEVPNNLKKFGLLFREQIGLIAYHWTGRSATSPPPMSSSH